MEKIQTVKMVKIQAVKIQTVKIKKGAKTKQTKQKGTKWNPGASTQPGGTRVGMDLISQRRLHIHN